MKKGSSIIIIIIIALIIIAMALFISYKLGTYENTKEDSNLSVQETNNVVKDVVVPPVNTTTQNNEALEKAKSARLLSDTAELQSVVTMHLAKAMSEYGDALIISAGSISEGTAYYTIKGKKIIINEQLLREELSNGKLPAGNWNIDADGLVTSK
jgi:hypothetical protein